MRFIDLRNFSAEGNLKVENLRLGRKCWAEKGPCMRKNSNKTCILYKDTVCFIYDRLLRA